MALNLTQLEQIMDSGESGDALDRFIARTLDESFEALREGRATSAEFDDQVIAAACLIRLLNNGHARAELNLPAHKKGKSYNADDLFLDPAIAELAALYHVGRIGSDEAMNRLSNALQSIYGDEPALGTMRRLLLDLEKIAAEQVAWIRQLEAAGEDVEAWIASDVKIIGQTSPERD